MYISVQDLRDEGVKDPPYNDAYLLQRIGLAQSTIERLLGLYFERRNSQTFRLAGRGHDTLRLQVPPVTVDSITSVTLDGVVIESTEYFVDMPDFPDGRLTPKLIRVGDIWSEGAQVILQGDFGFVDWTTGATPEPVCPDLVKALCARIAVYYLTPAGDMTAQRAGSLKREKLKDYEYEMRDDASRGSGLFGEPDIVDILRHFKPPRITTV